MNNCGCPNVVRNSVRPLDGISEDADSEREEMEDLKESKTPKGVKDVSKPCQAEIDEHNLTHLPFRDWCPYCVQGRGVSLPHRKRKIEENEIPVISGDYMGLKHREPEE